MTINKNVDIIRQGSRDYVNINSQNRLISKILSASADSIYAFNIPFGRAVDKKTAEEMKDTYWICVAESNRTRYTDDVQIVTL